MNANARALAQRSPRHLPSVASPALHVPWTPTLLAQALTFLLGRDISPGQVQEKAVGLGLLRQPSGEGPIALRSRAAARLLLAHQLPAFVENGSLAVLRDHCLAGRWTFVVLAEAEPLLFQVRGMDPEMLTLAASATARLESWPLERFRTAWATADHRLLVAARSWNDLPTDGLLFFGGLRDVDGAYHWNTAECDTDRKGRILRF
jgi:hypothetical protein